MYLCRETPKLSSYENPVYLFRMYCSFAGNLFMGCGFGVHLVEVQSSDTFFPDYIEDNKKTDFKESEIFEQSNRSNVHPCNSVGNAIEVNKVQPSPYRDVSKAQLNENLTTGKHYRKNGVV